MKKYLLLSILSLGLASCGKDKEEVVVDNPTSADITFFIDGKEYQLKANSFEELKLNVGNHTLKIPQGEEVSFEYAKGQGGSIINPTNTKYILVAENYSDIPIEQNHMYKLLFKDFAFDGDVYYGPFEAVEGYFIPHTEGKPWRYGLNEEFPESITVTDNGSKMNLTYKKIFRPAEFKKEYQDLIVEE